MFRPNRATLAVGLGLVGVAGLVGRSFGQQDKAVRPAAANTAPATAAVGPASIGSIDMDGVLKNYDKFKVISETLRAEMLARHNDLMKVANDAKMEQEKLARLAPGSPDAKKAEDRITQLKAQFEAGRENAQREFEQKEAETMATIYNEVAEMARGVANQRGMTFVVKYTEQKPSGSEPNSVMAAMSRTILYADPRVDITTDTIKYLNYKYKASGGQPPKTTGPAGNGLGVPAPGSAPAATSPAARTGAGAGGR